MDNYRLLRVRYGNHFLSRRSIFLSVRAVPVLPLFYFTYATAAPVFIGRARIGIQYKRNGRTFSHTRTQLSMVLFICCIILVRIQGGLHKGMGLVY